MKRTRRKKKKTELWRFYQTGVTSDRQLPGVRARVFRSICSFPKLSLPDSFSTDVLAFPGIFFYIYFKKKTNP